MNYLLLVLFISGYNIIDEFKVVISFFIRSKNVIVFNENKLFDV